MTNGPWVIEFSSPQIRPAIRVRMNGPIIVGRTVGGDPKQPDVDLGSFKAEEYGVSRLHYSVEMGEDGLTLVDLNSGNGTFLNGNRLKPEQRYHIGFTEQITAGLMKMDFNVVLAPSTGQRQYHQEGDIILNSGRMPKERRILIAEQDPILAAAFTEILEASGCSVRLTTEVVAAIRLYNQWKPQAVILDPVLPDVSGLELFRYIRRDLRGSTLPLIGVGTGTTITSGEASSAGADVFLERPISGEELAELLLALMIERETGNTTMNTKLLGGTAPIQATQPETRKNTCVLFVVGHNDMPVVLTVQQPITFGRQISTHNLRTHVDLTRYDAANRGVSRVHMMLHYRDGSFIIEDQDSVNGTFINGTQIKPRTPMTINNADEIRLGQLRMYLYQLAEGEAPPVPPAE
jgi:CheY-like chemotaxis protein